MTFNWKRNNSTSRQ